VAYDDTFISRGDPAAPGLARRRSGGARTIARTLLVINIAAYAVLWSLALLRLARFLPRALSDLTSHVRGPDFFTLVAGTCLLGVQLVIIASSFTVAMFLWFCGLALWLLVMYAFFTAMIIREEKPTLETGINGSWLLAVVATQSISVLGTLLAPHFNAGRELLLFFALSMYLIGCAAPTPTWPPPPACCGITIAARCR